jgi:hypothetical protein
MSKLSTDAEFGPVMPQNKFQPKVSQETLPEGIQDRMTESFKRRSLAPSKARFSSTGFKPAFPRRSSSLHSSPTSGDSTKAFDTAF